MTYEDFEREVKEIISDYVFAHDCAVIRKTLKGLKFTPFEEKGLYQEFREKAVEQFPDEDWEWVHREYDKIYEEYMGA